MILDRLSTICTNKKTWTFLISIAEDETIAMYVETWYATHAIMW